MPGYTFNADEFAQLLIARSYPEKTDHESALIRDYLKRHVLEFDRVEFSVRIGAPVLTDAELTDGVRRQAIANSSKRVDMIGYHGEAVTLVEAKTVLSHAVMGQLLMDRDLWMADHPDGPEPQMVAIGRRGTDQDLAVLASKGITIYVYETSDAE